jgi:hypothetical protein
MYKKFLVVIAAGDAYASRNESDTSTSSGAN